MAELTENPGTGTQDGGANPSPAVTGSGTPPEKNDGGAVQPAGQTFTSADMKAARLKWEQEVKEAKAKADLEAQGKHKELADKLQAELTAAQQRERTLAVKYELAIQATKLGIARPDLALKLIDNDKIEYDEAGQPTNLEKLLKAVIAELPALVATQATPATPAPTPSAGGPTNPAKGTQITFDPKRPPRVTDASIWSQPK